MQTPFLHTPPLPQAAPSFAGANLQVPVAGSQLSAVQGDLSSQLLGLPRHLPPTHLLPEVHRLPSSQLLDS